MKKSSHILAVAIALVSTALIGCVSVRRVTIQDAPRKNVTFESVRAMQLFYDALLAKHLPKERKPSRVRFGNTLYTRETRGSANLAFNEGVAAADTNSDGVISENEASAGASVVVE